MQIVVPGFESMGGMLSWVLIVMIGVVFREGWSKGGAPKVGAPNFSTGKGDPDAGDKGEEAEGGGGDSEGTCEWDVSADKEEGEGGCDGTGVEYFCPKFGTFLVDVQVFLGIGVEIGAYGAVFVTFVGLFTGFHDQEGGPAGEGSQGQSGEEGGFMVPHNADENRQEGEGAAQEGDMVNDEMEVFGSHEEGRGSLVF
jgi:hypothetical protein